VGQKGFFILKPQQGEAKSVRLSVESEAAGEMTKAELLALPSECVERPLARDDRHGGALRVRQRSKELVAGKFLSRSAAMNTAIMEKAKLGGRARQGRRRGGTAMDGEQLYLFAMGRKSAARSSRPRRS